MKKPWDKKPWDSFEKNYVAVEKTDPVTGKTKIRYEYYGPWFVCKNGKDALNRAKGGAGIALLVNVAASLWAGVQDSALNQSGLTSVPYGLSLAALIFTLVGTACLLASGEKVKRPDYERMHRLLSIAPLVQAVLLLLALIAGLFLLISGRAAARDTWPMAGYFLSGCGAAFTYFVYRALQYRKEKNTDFEFADDALTASIKTKSEVQ